jgi:type IV pilus modification protein PilV
LAFFKKSNGFSLIEVLIALVILAISLLALAGLMVQTTTSNSFGGHMTEASTFAQDKLEELRVSAWGDVASKFDTMVGSTNIIYNRTWTVAANGSGNLKTISISVSWFDKMNHTMAITILSTLSNDKSS